MSGYDGSEYSKRSGFSGGTSICLRLSCIIVPVENALQPTRIEKGIGHAKKQLY